MSKVDKAVLASVTHDLLSTYRQLEELLGEVTVLQRTYADLAQRIIDCSGGQEDSPSAFVHEGHLVSIDWTTSDSDLDWTNRVSVYPVETLEGF
jgi:hypothetical protein